MADYDIRFRHYCPQCQRTYMKEVCMTAYCDRKDRLCPNCNDLQFHPRFQYVDEFEAWVTEVRKEAGL